MSTYAVDGDKLTAIADAIRLKRGITTDMTLDDMALQIALIDGGGEMEREWSLLGTFAASQGDIEITGLDNYTEFWFQGEKIINGTSTASGYRVDINNKTIMNAFLTIGKSTAANYQNAYLKYNGLFWDAVKGADATTATNLTGANNNSTRTYAKVLDVGKAQSVKLVYSSAQYIPTGGTVTIYGR